MTCAYDVDYRPHFEIFGPVKFSVENMNIWIRFRKKLHDVGIYVKWHVCGFFRPQEVKLIG